MRTRILALMMSSLLPVCGAGALATEESVPPDDAAPPTVGSKQEEEKDIRLVFLRRSAVVLKPGEIELEEGFSYGRDRAGLPGFSDTLSRDILLSTSLRAGVLDWLEAFVIVPAGYAYREATFASASAENADSAATRSTVDDDSFGLGDVTAGLNVQLLRYGRGRPEIVGSLYGSAPTGGDPYGDSGPKASIGSGHWLAGGGLQFVVPSDPLVLFWGLGYAHYFAEDYIGAEIQPGEVFAYNFGFGFAVNPNISMSAQLLGSYRTETEFGGEDLEGTENEPISLRTGLTCRWLRRAYIEPTVTFGLNEDATDVILGVALVHSWSK